MVDVNEAELKKMATIGRPCETIKEDANVFLQKLYISGDFTDWLERIEGWKRDYPAIQPSYGPESPYRIME